MSLARREVADHRAAVTSSTNAGWASQCGSSRDRPNTSASAARVITAAASSTSSGRICSAFARRNASVRSRNTANCSSESGANGAVSRSRHSGRCSGDHALDRGAHRFAQRRLRRAALDTRARLGREPVAVPRPQRGEDRLLVGEVLVERADAHARGARDAVRGDGFRALGAQNVRSGEQDRVHGAAASASGAGFCELYQSVWACTSDLLHRTRVARRRVRRDHDRDGDPGHADAARSRGDST